MPREVERRSAMKTHPYLITVEWTGNLGDGTQSYKAYSRDHEILAPEKQVAIPGSSDPSFRGDPTRYNPEELLLASLSSCHMLWYLHLCASNGIVVHGYQDKAKGLMEERKNGSGQFKQAVLRPYVTIENPDHVKLAESLHKEANQLCFIAKSVNFPVLHEAVIVAAKPAS